MFVWLAMMAMQAEAPLTPTSNWVVDYGQNSCSIVRDFGPDHIAFGLRPDGFAGGGGMLVVFVPKARGAQYEEFSGQLRIAGGLDERVQVTNHLLRQPAGVLTTVRVGSELLGKLKTASSFSIPVSRRRNIAFAPNGLTAPLAALDKCSDNLMEQYGVPGAELALATTRAKPRNAAGWFSSASYPLRALNDGQQGRIAAVVAVSADGKPTDCKPIEAGDLSIFGETTCATVMRQGSFDPARNAAGEAIRSWTMLVVNFRM